MAVILDTPKTPPRALYVMAHGADAGMRHPFLGAMAELLVQRGVAVLRFDFPYMAAHKKRVDTPEVSHAAVRAAVDEAAKRLPGVPLVAGGKSFGGRMTSQAQALAPLPGVRGLVFISFPLHPPDRPGIERAEHLGGVKIPMLFLQGTRDEFAELPRLEGVVAGLGKRARLVLFEGGDHGFKVRGEKEPVTRARLADAIVAWIDGVALK